MKRFNWRRWLVVVGYGAFALLCLAIFSVWTFPFEQLKEFVVYSVEYRSSGSATRTPTRASRAGRPSTQAPRVEATGYQLEIVDLGFSFPFGFEATGVRFALPPSEEGGVPNEIIIDEAELDLSLWGLLKGNIDADYALGLSGGGTIEGKLGRTVQGLNFIAALSDVNLRPIGLIRSKLGLPVSGTANGIIGVNLAARPTDSTGAVQLMITALQIGDGRAKLKLPGMTDGITIERVDAGRLEARMQIEAGTARIETLRVRGPDLDLEGSGTLALNDPFGSSRLDMTLRFKFTDGYRNRNDRTQALFSLMDFNPQLRRARTPEGFLQYRLSGAVAGGIRASPAGTAPERGGAVGAEPSHRPAPAVVPAFDDVDDEI